jgi:hypothetical protein
MTLFLCHLLHFLLHFDNFVLDHLYFFKVLAYSGNYSIPGSLDVPASREHIVHRLWLLINIGGINSLYELAILIVIS